MEPDGGRERVLDMSVSDGAINLDPAKPAANPLPVIVSDMNQNVSLLKPVFLPFITQRL